MENLKENKMATQPIKPLSRKMGLSMIVSMVLQALGYAGKPLALSFFRLVLFVFPVAYLFALSERVLDLVWWTFHIAEVLSCAFAVVFLKQAVKNKIEKL